MVKLVDIRIYFPVNHIILSQKIVSFPQFEGKHIIFSSVFLVNSHIVPVKIPPARPGARPVLDVDVVDAAGAAVLA